jgi:hypothetical protein
LRKQNKYSGSNKIIVLYQNRKGKSLRGNIEPLLKYLEE